MSLISRLVACSARIVADRQTDRQTHRTTTVTLAAHARRGLIIIQPTVSTVPTFTYNYYTVYNYANSLPGTPIAVDTNFHAFSFFKSTLKSLHRVLYRQGCSLTSLISCSSSHLLLIGAHFTLRNHAKVGFCSNRCVALRSCLTLRIDLNSICLRCVSLRYVA